MNRNLQTCGKEFFHYHKATFEDLRAGRIGKEEAAIIMHDNNPTEVSFTAILTLRIPAGLRYLEEIKK